MPFVSEAQRRKFYSDPRLKKYIPEFEAATPKGNKLPDHVPQTLKNRIKTARRKVSKSGKAKS